MRSWVVLVGPSFLVACSNPKGGSPCADGAWGGLGDAGSSAVQVRADGDDASADGSAEAPYGSLAAALAAVGEAGGADVFVGPGDYPSAATVTAPDVGVYGCSGGTTVLTDVDPSAPDALVVVDGATDFVLADLALHGGRRSLLVAGGAQGEVATLSVEGATRTGILVAGAVDLTLTDVSVRDTVPEVFGGTYAIGFGISVEGAGIAEGSTANISMEGGEIVGSTAVGLVASEAVLTVSDLRVSGTLAVAGDDGPRFGRAVQLQTFSVADISGMVAEDNADAAIFASSSSLSLAGSEVRGTSAGALPDGAASGDGVVVRRAEVDSSFDPSFFAVSLTDNVIDGNARAGVVLENVAVDALAGNSGTNGLVVEGTSLLVQGDTDAAAATDPVATPETPLTFDEILAPDSEEAR